MSDCPYIGYRNIHSSKFCNQLIFLNSYIDLTLDAFINAAGGAIRCVTGVVHKFTFLFTRWALLGRLILFDHIPTV